MNTTPSPNSVVKVGAVEIGSAKKLAIIAGPCQLESRAHALEVASALKEIATRLGIGLVYKTSFDKANRTSAASARGLGLDAALPIFAEIRDSLGLPVLTDVHEAEQCARAAEAVDILQIPAFLCRQTDLLLAAAATGKVVNVKKGQFLAPWDMKHVAAKVTEAGNPNVIVQNMPGAGGLKAAQYLYGIAEVPAVRQPADGPLRLYAAGRIDEDNTKGVVLAIDPESNREVARVEVNQRIADLISQGMTNQQATETAIRETQGQITNLGTKVDNRISELIQQGLTNQQATEQAIRETQGQITQTKEELGTQLTQTKQELGTKIEDTNRIFNQRVDELVQQGKTYQEATQQAFKETNQNIADVKAQQEAAAKAARAKEAQAKTATNLAQAVSLAAMPAAAAAATDESTPFKNIGLKTSGEAKFEGPLEQYLKMVKGTNYAQKPAEAQQQQKIGRAHV